MHELALAEEIVQLVDAQARAQAFARVRRIRLVVGALAGVEPDALEFGFESVRRGTALDGAALEILRTPGVGRCLACERDVEIGARGESCPSCGSNQVLVIGGEELRVAELEVE